jgi:hypothetical protein
VRKKQREGERERERERERVRERERERGREGERERERERAYIACTASTCYDLTLANSGTPLSFEDTIQAGSRARPHNRAAKPLRHSSSPAWRTL